MSRYLFGREKIELSMEKVTAENISAVVKATLPTHLMNKLDIDYLYEYFKGNQPIIGREKEIRPSITNNIVENNAYQIVTFQTNYVFSDAIQYVRRGDKTVDDRDGLQKDNVSLAISHLNEYMYSENKQEVDREIGEWQNICGTAYRGVLPDNSIRSTEDDAPFEIFSIDPRQVYVVYSTNYTKDPLVAVYITSEYDVKTKRKETRYTCYTDNACYTLNNSFEILSVVPHILGGIPIIEYPANTSRLGAFEPVLSMLDALNALNSNRVDGVEQFVQYLIKFVNCDLDSAGYQEMLKEGAISINSVDGKEADVDIMTAELNQNQTQTLVDYMYKKALKIAGMPYSDSATGGDTGQAVQLRDGWTETESRAKGIETMFIGSEKQFLKIVLNIVSTKVGGFNLKLGNIDVKFTRNRTDNLLVKTQGLQNLLEAGISPSIAINQVGLFSDPEQVALDSQEYLEKWKTKEKPTPFQQTDATKDRAVETGLANLDSNISEKMTEKSIKRNQNREV